MAKTADSYTCLTGISTPTAEHVSGDVVTADDLGKALKWLLEGRHVIATADLEAQLAEIEAQANATPDPEPAPVEPDPEATP